MSATNPPTVALPESAPPLHKLWAKCEELALTNPKDTQQMASLLQQMSLNYYQDVRRQAQQSFYGALAAAIIGMLFFLYAALHMIPNSANPSSRAYISLIAGGLVEVISATYFYLYAKAVNQFAGFHVCLERTNRFLLVNTLCENLGDKHKDEMRMELIKVIANAPMLTPDIMNGSTPQSSVEKPDETELSPAAE